MDKKIDSDEKIIDINHDNPQEEGKEMPALAKEKSYEGYLYPLRN